ncbi:unnamed protein product, partial [Mesorhabditis spiculigera]
MLVFILFATLLGGALGCVPGQGRSPPITITVTSKIPKAWVNTAVNAYLIPTALKASLGKAFAQAESENPQLKGYSIDNVHEITMVPPANFFCVINSTTTATNGTNPTSPTQEGVCTLDQQSQLFVIQNILPNNVTVTQWAFSFVLGKVAVPTTQGQLTKFADALQDGLEEAENLDSVKVDAGTLAAWQAENQ